MPNGLELSRPAALGSPPPTLPHHQWAFESPFSAAVEVGSSELLDGPDLNPSEVPLTTLSPC
jgi:hypothetical protein